MYNQMYNCGGLTTVIRTKDNDIETNQTKALLFVGLSKNNSTINGDRYNIYKKFPSLIVFFSL